MIVNAAGTLAISYLRWLDAGNLWVHRADESGPQLLHVPGADWLTLIHGAEDRFAIVHHSTDARVKLTSYSLRDVSETLSSIDVEINDARPSVVETSSTEFTGEPSAWSFLPRAYLVQHLEETFLFLVNWKQKRIEIQTLPRYGKSYDTMYQGILGVAEIPGTSFLIFSMQRDSQLVVYDPSARRVVKELNLGGQSGSPQLFFRDRAPELWASDYDSIVRLDTRSWNVLGALKLQEGQQGMVRCNIGTYCFSRNEDLCVVARPHSGDVLGVDPNGFAVALRAKTGGQPQDVGPLCDNRVIARDLTSGRPLYGALQPV